MRKFKISKVIAACDKYKEAIKVNQKADIEGMIKGIMATNSGFPFYRPRNRDDALTILSRNNSLNRNELMDINEYYSREMRYIDSIIGMCVAPSDDPYVYLSEKDYKLIKFIEGR
jgi:hypothetical protein